MTVLKELCVAQRKYTNSNGEEKTQWLKIGEIHEKDGREYGVIYPHINLAALPRKEGDDRLFFSLFNPKPKEVKGKTQSVDIESDLPF
jgi:hypothetical protein